MLIPIKLSEGNTVPLNIQLLKVGEFLSDEFGDKGKLKITAEMLSAFKKNFDLKVRGYEDGKLPIDYFHENEKIAAGWIESLSIADTGDELWAQVKWTPKASQMLADGELRYVSSEFHFNYQDNETGKKFGPTLFGAGLTNRPFIKGMDPIAMFQETQKGGLGTMDLEQALAKIKELETMIAQMQAAKATTEVDMADMKNKIACAEKTNDFNKLLAAGKVVEAQRESFIKGDMVQFSELAKPTNLNARGSNSETTIELSQGESSQEKIIELAKKAVKEEKITFSEAVQKVLHKESELYKGYLKETTLQ